MRYQTFNTSWTGPFGLFVEVDKEKTLKKLEYLLGHDQDKDAYWEAFDILSNEEPFSVRDKDYWDRYNSLKTKLLKEVKNQEGYINRGVILKDGHGRTWWEKLNKEDSIGWALANFILN